MNETGTVNMVMKQAWEEFPIGIDFASEMAEGETVSAGLSVAVVDGATVDIPIVKPNSIVVVDDTILQVTIYGGAIGGRYNINMRAFINDNKKLEDDIILIVR